MSGREERVVAAPPRSNETGGVSRPRRCAEQGRCPRRQAVFPRHRRGNDHCPRCGRCSRAAAPARLPADRGDQPAREQRLMMTSVNQLKVTISADGADKAAMLDMYKNPHVKGFTTNPSLMRKAGVTDYEAAARDIAKAIPDRSISFEVFADDFADMERQARRITTWGKQVSVKIPITNTKRE